MIGIDYFTKLYPLDANLTICDVGAHHGDSVWEFLEMFPQSNVFAFEPDADNYRQLIKRFSGDARVKVLNVAVSQQNGHGLLHRNNYDATHSLLPFHAEEINRWADANNFREEGTVEVELATLDTFCKTNEIAKIDILKLDIQGGELLAFQGSVEMLSNQLISCIFCEVEFRPLYENQPLFWDISAHLMSRAYHFVNIVSPKLSEMGVLSWADAIFVNDHLWQGIATKHSAGKLIF